MIPVPTRILFSTSPADFRNSIDGLAGIQPPVARSRVPARALSPAAAPTAPRKPPILSHKRKDNRSKPCHSI